MKYFLIGLVFFLSLFLETTFLSVPLVLLSVILLGVLFKEGWIFPAAFVMGILLDMLSFHTIGMSSIFFVVVLGIMFLYQRKFEIQSLQFVTIFPFLASLLFGIVFGQDFVLLSAVSMAIISGGIFYIIWILGTNTNSRRIS